MRINGWSIDVKTVIAVAIPLVALISWGIRLEGLAHANDERSRNNAEVNQKIVEMSERLARIETKLERIEKDVESIEGFFRLDEVRRQ